MWPGVGWCVGPGVRRGHPCLPWPAGWSGAARRHDDDWVPPASGGYGRFSLCRPARLPPGSGGRVLTAILEELAVGGAPSGRLWCPGPVPLASPGCGLLGGAPQQGRGQGWGGGSAGGVQDQGVIAEVGQQVAGLAHDASGLGQGGPLAVDAGADRGVVVVVRGAAAGGGLGRLVEQPAQQRWALTREPPG